MKRVLILTLLLAACSPPVVRSTPNSCASLVPADWAKGVPGADLPSGDTVADWIVFGDSQTGKLDQANGRQRDTLSIITACEARDALAVKESSRGFFGRLFN